MNIAKTDFRTKVAAFTGSAVGVAGAVALIGRRHGIRNRLTLNRPKEMLKMLKEIELKEKDVIEIAASSVFCGFAAGSVSDRKNIKAKAKEGIVQLVGNYIIPTIAVGAGIRLNKVLNTKFNFPPITGAIQFLFGFVGLVAGVVAGNRISRKMNSHIFKEDEYRKLNWKDWAMQSDNVCLVASVSNAGTALAKAASGFIPLAHLAPGYQTGIKK